MIYALTRDISGIELVETNITSSKWVIMNLNYWNYCNTWGSAVYFSVLWERDSKHYDSIPENLSDMVYTYRTSLTTQNRSLSKEREPKHKPSARSVNLVQTSPSNVGLILGVSHGRQAGEVRVVVCLTGIGTGTRVRRRQGSRHGGCEFGIKEDR
jgi:hypothetical protein